MSEIEYRNRSISQLVSELNTLGQANVILQPVRLLAVHEHDISELKRFKNSHGQQFFTVQSNQKKYLYNQITQKIVSPHLRLLTQLYSKGFNATVLLCLPREQERLAQFIGQITKWMGHAAYCALQYGEQQIVDMVSQSKIAERDIQNRLKFYRVKQSNAFVFLDRCVRGQGKVAVNVIKIRRIDSNQPSKNQVNLIVLPEEFFSQHLKSSDYLGVIRSQLTQIFNYIKLNPNKKYQHFSKLLTKRLPITNLIASLILEQSCSLVINLMNEGNLANLCQRLAFYQKIRGLSIFLKIEQGYCPVMADLPANFHSGASSKNDNTSKRRDKPSKTDRTPIAHFNSDENDLEYCRSLERKTHKYSINEGNQDGQLFPSNHSPSEQHSEFKVTYNTPSPVTHHFKNDKVADKNSEHIKFDETLPKKGNENLRQSEQMAILRANHAVQISQYHQTIQQLNRKILALSHENGLDQLYTLHQRELMLLQLKIKELRSDISALCKGGDDKSYKGMVRKLNEEIKRIQNKNAEQKVSNGRVLLLEKQLHELRGKYDESEAARKKLAYELDYLTKRLKICDAEIQTLNVKEARLNEVKQYPASLNAHSPSTENKLSTNDVEYLKEVNVLLGAVKEGNQNSRQFLVRKITNVLEDLSACRNTILECNDFLVQLQEHLQEKLGSKEPQIVLDCNKFIRNFLMDNLNIF